MIDFDKIVIDGLQSISVLSHDGSGGYTKRVFRKSSRRATAATSLPVAFADIMDPTYEGLPNAFALLGMANRPLSDNKAIGGVSAIINKASLTNKQEAAIIDEVQKAREVFNKHDELSSIYFEQEMAVESVLRKYANPVLHFNGDRMQEMWLKMSAERERILSVLRRKSNGRIFKHIEPLIKKLQTIKELDDLGIGITSWHDSNRMAYHQTSMNDYVKEVLKHNRNSSELCSELYWYFYDFSKLLITMKNILHHKYCLSASLVNCATITGRILTYDENIQGVTKPLRHCIETPDGMVMIGVDFRNCEPGVIAGQTGNEFRYSIENGDIYTEIGEIAQPLCPHAKNGLRDLGKGILVRILNGATEHGISTHTGSSLENAKMICELIHQKYAGSMDALDRMAKECCHDNVMRIERAGLRMAQVVPQANPKDRGQCEKLKRTKKSVVAQGAATLLFKKAILRLPPVIEEYGLKLLYPTHDAFLFLMPEGNWKEGAIAVKNMMDQTAFEFNGFESENITAKIETNWHRKRPLR